MFVAFVFVVQARLEMQGAIKKYMGQLTDTTVPIEAERRQVVVWCSFLTIRLIGIEMIFTCLLKASISFEIACVSVPL